MSVYNPLGLCKFIIKGKVGPEGTAQLVNTALGWGWGIEDVLTTGDRLFQLKRLINIEWGIGTGDDILPKRLLTEARPSGFAEGVLPDLELMLPIYYGLRGWNAEGVPEAQRLTDLDLADLQKKRAG